MRLFRRRRVDVPEGAGECMMYGADLRPLVRAPERAAGPDASGGE